MNEKDAAIKKVLAELGLKEEPELTPEQEELLKTALDPKEQELADMLRVLQKSS
jgi:hypothetical protein